MKRSTMFATLLAATLTCSSVLASDAAHAQDWAHRPVTSPSATPRAMPTIAGLDTRLALTTTAAEHTGAVTGLSLLMVRPVLQFGLSQVLGSPAWQLGLGPSYATHMSLDPQPFGPVTPLPVLVRDDLVHLGHDGPHAYGSQCQAGPGHPLACRWLTRGEAEAARTRIGSPVSTELFDGTPPGLSARGQRHYNDLMNARRRAHHRHHDDRPPSHPAKDKRLSDDRRH